MSESDASEATDDSTDAPSFPASRCPTCEALYGHRPAVCRECGSETFEKGFISGAGSLYASTTIRVPGSDHQGQEPFTVGLVDVGDTERVRVTARLDLDDVDDHLSPDTSVEFVGVHDEAFHFRPV